MMLNGMKCIDEIFPTDCSCSSQDVGMVEWGKQNQGKYNKILVKAKEYLQYDEMGIKW